MSEQNHGHGAAAEEPEELIDLEEWAKAGKTPKPAKTYRIRIDTVKKDVTVASMSGRDILGLVGKTPETHMLSQKIRGGAPTPIGADQTVRFDTPGIERFQTLARDPTEGQMTTELANDTTLRREFKLPAEDVESLSALGLPWETIIEGGTKWLIIRGYPIPRGYDHQVTDLALRISPSYPDDQIDMVYFSPVLALTSAKTIRQLSPTTIEGKTYQQWSRHRTSANPWRPGLDNVGTHLLQVNDWLQRELN